MIGILAYKAQPEIYGVVSKTSSNCGYKVTWCIQRLFNIDADAFNFDYEYIGTTHLTLVKKKDDPD